MAILKFNFIPQNEALPDGDYLFIDSNHEHYFLNKTNGNYKNIDTEEIVNIDIFNLTHYHKLTKTLIDIYNFSWDIEEDVNYEKLENNYKFTDSKRNPVNVFNDQENKLIRIRIEEDSPEIYYQTRTMSSLKIEDGYKVENEISFNYEEIIFIQDILNHYIQTYELKEIDELKYTNRNFAIASLEDSLGNPYTFQESSSGCCLWFGMNSLNLIKNGEQKTIANYLCEKLLITENQINYAMVNDRLHLNKYNAITLNNIINEILSIQYH